MGVCVCVCYNHKWHLLHRSCWNHSSSGASDIATPCWWRLQSIAQTESTEARELQRVQSHWWYQCSRSSLELLHIWPDTPEKNLEIIGAVFTDRCPSCHQSDNVGAMIAKVLICNVDVMSTWLCEGGLKIHGLSCWTALWNTRRVKVRLVSPLLNCLHGMETFLLSLFCSWTFWTLPLTCRHYGQCALL